MVRVSQASPEACVVQGPDLWPKATGRNGTGRRSGAAESDPGPGAFGAVFGPLFLANTVGSGSICVREFLPITGHARFHLVLEALAQDVLYSAQLSFVESGLYALRPLLVALGGGFFK